MCWPSGQRKLPELLSPSSGSQGAISLRFRRETHSPRPRTRGGAAARRAGSARPLGTASCHFSSRFVSWLGRLSTGPWTSARWEYLHHGDRPRHKPAPRPPRPAPTSPCTAAGDRSPGGRACLRPPVDSVREPGVTYVYYKLVGAGCTFCCHYVTK